MGKMKEEFIRLREIEMLNTPPFIWNGEVEYPDFPEEDLYEMGVEMPNERDLDNLFNLDEDE